MSHSNLGKATVAGAAFEREPRVAGWYAGPKATMQFAQMALKRRRQSEAIDSLTREISELQQEIGALTLPSFSVQITTLAPEAISIKRDIPVVVTPNGDDFIATFFDAGLSATGDTDNEAVGNLKDIIVQTFKVLRQMPEETLGILPKKQLAVLNSILVQVGN